jgi:hypothetical protein
MLQPQKVAPSSTISSSTLTLSVTSLPGDSGLPLLLNSQDHLTYDIEYYKAYGSNDHTSSGAYLFKPEDGHKKGDHKFQYGDRWEQLEAY